MAAAFAFALLLAVYVASLAPGLTFWDAGEFQSAIATLGIPHPPGAPLYILLGRVWTQAWPQTWLPVLMNLLSAVATALTGALVARLFSRWMGNALIGIGAGIVGGLGLSVWQNATETEVYALSLMAGVLLLTVADLAGGEPDANADSPAHGRWASLLAYLMGLSGALHLDALLAVPAAALLASSVTGERAARRRLVLRWVGPALMAIGASKASVGLTLTGIAGSAAWVGLPLPGSRVVRARRAMADAGLVILGVSCAAFMLVRATHDPGINQGDPSTWQRFLSALARDQYDVPGLWPRRAPFWLQLGNVFQYLDWQVGFGLDDATTLSFVRTPLTVAMLILSVVGAREHFRHDPRSARAWTTYAIAGSIGAVVILNLEAGPSIGFGILPASAGHEARERDYFFVPAFLAVGAWAFVGAMVATRQLAHRLQRLVMLLLPAAIVGGNWRATDRRIEPDASLPPLLGRTLLMSAPQDAVLLLAGDNDSYSIWQTQWVDGFRRDVVPVTLPLLPAEWYRRELRRRFGLLSTDATDDWEGLDSTLLDLSRNARRVQRPLSIAMSVDADVRMALREDWAARGLIFVERPKDALGAKQNDSVTRAVVADVAVPDGTGRDPTSRYVARLLNCPRLVETDVADRSLDSVCNFR